MKVELWWIGKSKQPFIHSGIDLYKSRLKHYCKFGIKEIKDIKQSHKMQDAIVKIKESESVLSQLNSDDFLILLDEKGKIFTSRAFSTQLEKIQNQGLKRIVFLIGGAFGFDEKLYLRANLKISLSKMTFSHQLIRIIFLEQLYRAFTIQKGEKYHND